MGGWRRRGAIPAAAILLVGLLTACSDDRGARLTVATDPAIEDPDAGPLVDTAALQTPSRV